MKILNNAIAALALSGMFAAPIQAGTVKIGAIFAETGPASYLGVPEANTARMLVEELNAKGGVNGDKIQLIIKDSGSSPEKAVSFAKQLIEEEKVLAILGPSTSGETMQIKALCEENKMILLSCASAEVIINPVAKYVFKVPPKDKEAVMWIFKDMKAKGIRKIVILSSNDGFGKAGKTQIETLAPAEGIEVVANEVYDKQATDLTDILTKVKSAGGVQAVINWSIVPAQSIVSKNMKQLGFNVQLYQSPGFANRKYAEQAGVSCEGVIFPAGRLPVADELPDNHVQKKVLTEYKKGYEAKFKDDVSTFGGHAYDALMAVVEGIKKAGSTDRDKVRDAIETLQFVGTAGEFKFSPDNHSGLTAEAFEMQTVKNGKFAIYKK
jgi:branched-chain amino acid transport system substrate-binding protein